MSLNRHPLLYVALLAFVFTRAVTPAGYMPGTVEDDAPFVLCPSDTGSAAWLALAQGSHQNHHGHDADHAQHEHDGQHASGTDCPLSGLGSPASLEPAAARSVPPLQGVSAPIASTAALTPRTRYRLPHTRAPPHTV